MSLFVCSNPPPQSLAEKVIKLNCLDLAFAITAIVLVTLGLLAYHNIPPVSHTYVMIGSFTGAGLIALTEIVYKCFAGVLSYKAPVSMTPKPVAPDSDPTLSFALSKSILQPSENLTLAGLESYSEIGENPDNLTTTSYLYGKDRYTNILPYTHNVFQYTCPGYQELGYINASCLHSGDIMTQGPMPETQMDFWNMVFDSSGECIVMTTPHVEGKKQKCSYYYPNSGENKEFEKFVLIENKGSFVRIQVKSLEEVRIEGGIVQRRFQLKRTISTEKEVLSEEQKEIVHFQTPNWKDHGTFGLKEISFLLEMTEPYTGKKIVHCSAGVGRSGTYVACEMVKKIIDAIVEEGKAYTLNILNLITFLRTQRFWAVQTEGQAEMVVDFARHYMATKKI